MQRFELREGASSKFWEVEVSGSDLTARFGRIGTAGQTKTKTFADAAAALKERDKLVKEKTGKGYGEVAVAADAGLAKAPAPPAAAPAPAEPAPAPAPAPSAEAEPDPAPAPAAATATAAVSLEWPSGGYQWPAHDKRHPMPIVRGIHVTPLELGPGLLADLPRLRDDDTNGFLAQEMARIATAAGRNWQYWGHALSAERITEAALRQADPEYWLELMAQSAAQWHASSMLPWVLRTAIYLHGLPFALDVYLDLCEFDAGRRSQGCMALVRQAVAAADEAAHDAARAVAERARARSGYLRVIASHLFPHEQAWAVDCVEQKLDDPYALLRECVMPPEVAAAYAKAHGLTLPWANRQVDLQVHLHGEAAFPLLETLLDNGIRYSAATAAEAVAALGRMRVPQLIPALVARMESKEVRAELDKLARSYPAAVLLAAIEHAQAARSRTVEGWAVRLALREPAALQGALAALDEADARRFQALLDALGREEASADALPPLLRQPPWTLKQRPQPLPQFDDVPMLPVEERIEWPREELERCAKFTPHGWRLRDLPANARKEVYVLREMCIAESSIEHILAGQPVVAQDIVKRPYYHGQPVELLLYLPPAVQLSVWQSYPPQLWYSWGANVEAIKALLALHGRAAIPGLAIYAASRAIEGLEIAAEVDSPQLVPVALHALRNLKKAKAIASQWMRDHARTVLTAGLVLAFGKDKSARDNAQHGIRWLVNNGFEPLAREVAAAYGGAMPAALQALLDADPLNVLPSRMPKLPGFFVPAAFRRPELRDGAAVPLSAVEHIGTMLAISKLDEPYAGLEIVRQACTPESLAEFAWDLYEAWAASGTPSKENWAFNALGLLGNDETARRLAPKIREWPGESAHARAVAGLDLLATIGTDVALMHLNGIASKVKFKALQDRAKEKIEAVAEMRGFSAEELADRLVPDLGLDESGTLRLDFGPRHFFVGFDEALKPFVKDAQGVRLKDLPKPLKSDDAAVAEASVERFKQMKKDAKAIASLQVGRLEMGMVMRRRWSAADFRMFFLGHPLMRHLAARVVWGVYADGALKEAFRVAEDWTLADADDSLYTLADDATVGIAHVLEMPAPLQAAFGQIFADYEILQPFTQLGRETYALAEAERATSQLHRFKDKVVATGSVMGLVNRGWERGAAEDGGWVGSFSKRMPNDLEVELSLDPGTVVGDVSYEPKQKLPALTLRKRNTWNQDGLVAFGALDPILISEVLRDVELLAPLKD